MLVGYLRAMGAHEAKELVIVGDGALWIWGRTALLAEKIAMPFDRVREVIDWYHAVEKLHEVAAVPSGWSQTRRKRWVEKAKDHLYALSITHNRCRE